MELNSCFLCAEECVSSNLFLINLETKKHKTKYPFLIGNLIKNEYEIRISKSDQICTKCSTILEKYDELDRDTRILKSVLSRQIAHTYNIETDAEEIFLDKSKVFTEVRSNGSSDSSHKYSCKQCPAFITDNLDTVNSHIVFHQIANEEAKQKVNSTNNGNNAAKTAPTPPATANKQKNITREVQKTTKLSNSKTSNNAKSSSTANETPQVTPTPSSIQFQISTTSSSSSISNTGQELNEDTLDSLIDLELLENEFYDSNLLKHKCHMNNCHDEITYASDYVRHLKLKHKFAANQIISAFKANLKRPTKMSQLTCPYCFTKTGSTELLEQHVKQHEAASKTGALNERLNEFISNIIRTCRCSVCDCEWLDPTVLTCNHEIVKNGMAPKMNCIYCDDYFYSNKLYNNHLALRHGHCFSCGFTCNDRSVLKDHIQSHFGHSEYACQFCKDIYQTSTNRGDHIRAKHTNHCCPHCEEWYVNQTDLNHHIRYAHADKRSQEKASICDICGQSFKNLNLYERHISVDHKQRRIYKCTTCVLDFKFRYLLMDHLSSVHNRTVVDNEVNFYKCCFCSKGFSSQSRQAFITHINMHQTSNSYCYDCNTNTESINHLETHRERCHQDFSKCGSKSDVPEVVNKKTKTTNSKRKSDLFLHQPLPSSTATQQSQQNTQVSASSSPKPMQFEFNGNNSNVQQQQPGQQIVLQSEDGSLLNMNNLILTENGELIIQNLDGLLPNGQEGDEGSQIQISNLEQFLMEQGLSGNAEISYIQPDMIGGDDSQVIIQNAQQDSLLQTYKEIFEPNDELIGVTETEQQSQNMLLNGEYLIETPQQKAVNNTVQQSQNSIEHVDVTNAQQALDAANQSTLDELGDILLEVAAAAEKEKKPKVSEQKALRETLWGKKRNLEPIKEPNPKRRSGKLIEPVPESDTPARDFSQAYEIFVRGFDAKKQKQL